MDATGSMVRKTYSRGPGLEGYRFQKVHSWFMETHPLSTTIGSFDSLTRSTTSFAFGLESLLALDIAKGF